MSKSTNPRPRYLDTPNADRAAYVSGLGDMFGAARAKQIPTEGDKDRTRMINAIRRYLGDKNITSRQQLEPVEMQVMALAIERGYFNSLWLLAPQTHDAKTLRNLIEGNARRAREASARRANALNDFDFDSIID